MAVHVRHRVASNELPVTSRLRSGFGCVPQDAARSLARYGFSCRINLNPSNNPGLFTIAQPTQTQPLGNVVELVDGTDSQITLAADLDSVEFDQLMYGSDAGTPTALTVDSTLGDQNLVFTNTQFDGVDTDARARPRWSVAV